MTLLLFILWNYLSLPISSTERREPDSCVYRQTIEHLSFQKEATMADRMVQSALFFLNKPYVAATLEINEEEELVVNLREFDCTTLVENCLALSRTSLSDQQDFGAFKEILRKTRYRNGSIQGYPSRLHYSSDWIYENEQTGHLKDISQELGGVPVHFQLDYMSTHPQSYQQLVNEPGNIALIEKVESAINTRTYYYIQKKDIPLCREKIQNGDIVYFVTSIKGLDISHVGIAYHTKGELSFIHASSKAGKVIVDPDSLYDYCMKNKSNKGIIVCRPTPD